MIHRLYVVVGIVLVLSGGVLTRVGHVEAVVISM